MTCISANMRLQEKNSASESHIKDLQSDVRELNQKVEARLSIDSDRLNKLAEQRAEEIIGERASATKGARDEAQLISRDKAGH